MPSYVYKNFSKSNHLSVFKNYTEVVRQINFNYVLLKGKYMHKVNKIFNYIKSLCITTSILFYFIPYFYDKLNDFFMIIIIEKNISMNERKLNH